MPYKSQIPIIDKHLLEVIQEHFPNEKIEITEIEKSFVNPVFQFTVSSDKSYILKINNPEWPQKQTREIKAMTLAKTKTTIPLPQIIADHNKDDKYPFSYLILEKLPGMDLRDIVKKNLITKKEFLSIIRKVGFHLGELHAISFDFFGDFCIKQKNSTSESFTHFWGKQFTSWKECFKAFCYDMLNWVDQVSFPNYRKPLTWKIEELTEKFTENNEKGSFVHSDIQPTNVIIKNGKITGIIDFEWSYAGSPSFDFHLTKAGFFFSSFPSLEKNIAYTKLDLNQEEIQKEMLSGYKNSSSNQLTDLPTELLDFVWLLYMIGSWNWSVQSSTSEEIKSSEQSIHELFSRVIS
ncbi:MAG: aminoglycoside phosphotransferase family protein [Candidatus Heimdallarchaeota archaeon]|nr:aminoglycoside phosphotransferase family protein [Candidatus Heimdallarchaeota archaeon]MBY8995789.1 aminoglycoside phosphotransferase family protein [Candidatus Heimdallarchaeota archaeon]